jgi:hypothetical protein
MEDYMTKASQFQEILVSGTKLYGRYSQYLNELVIGEIRNNASAIFEKFFFSCCK